MNKRYHYVKRAIERRYGGIIQINEEHKLREPNVLENIVYIVEHYNSLERRTEVLTTYKYKDFYYELRVDWEKDFSETGEFYDSFLNFLSQLIYYAKIIRSDRKVDKLTKKLLELFIYKTPTRIISNSFEIGLNVSLDHDYVENGDFRVGVKGREFLEEIYAFNQVLEIYKSYKEGIKDNFEYTLEQIYDGIYKQLVAIIKNSKLPYLFQSIYKGDIADKLLKIKKFKLKPFTEELDENDYLKDVTKKLFYMCYPLLIPFKLVRISNDYKEKLLNEVLALTYKEQSKYISKSDIQNVISTCDLLLNKALSNNKLEYLLN